VKLLLDTNAYSALARGEPAVAERVRKARLIVMSSIVVGELLYGFRCGNRLEVNCGQLDAFLARPFVAFAPAGLTTADRFSRIMSLLRRNGRPIPTNDVWIAAHTMETGTELLTRDGHFDAVDGLVYSKF